MITIARKDRVVRRIDERNDNIITGGGNLIQIGSTAPTMPGVIQPPPPEDITVGTQVLLRTTYTPKVAVNVSWGAPANLLPEFYLIQYAESSDFTTNPINVTTSLNSIALEMKTETDYWIRVKAMIRNIYSEWGYLSNYPAISVTTIGDDTPPNDVTGVSTNWTSDDLVFSWTNPSSSNYFDARIRIYDTFGGTLLKETFVPGSPGGLSTYAFRLADNIQVTAGSPLTSIYYTIFARSLAHVLSPVGVTGTATKTPPTKPTGLSDSWNSDDGTFDEGLTISWTPVTGATKYLVTVDGAAKTVFSPFYNYSYDQNVSDHRPTLVSGDYSIAYTVRAGNGLGQLSGGASGTAINIAPQSSNLSLATVAGFSSLYAYVSVSHDILDFYGYNWTLKSGGVNVRQVTSFTPEITFTTLNGSYILEVYAIDKFGQRSTAVSGAVVLDGLTIDQLRAETQYTNSLGTNPTTLAGLKDNDLLTSVFTVASGTTWRWTKAERPLLDRYRTITLAFSGAATNMPRVYFGLSSDDSTYTYWSGPLVATGTTGQSTTLTSYGGSESNAQTNAILATNINRFDLPSITEARFVKVGHRGNIHNMTEYYPRRLLQSDDIEAETIKGINIAAATISADKMSVINLSSITANVGQLTITNPAGNAWIYQGTGTGDAPTTGLKIYNTGGIGQLTTYSGGTAQVSFDTLGRLTAAAGAIVLDQTGINITAATSTYLPDRAYGFTTTLAERQSDIWALETASARELNIQLYRKTGRTSEISLITDAPTGKASSITLSTRVNGSIGPELVVTNGLNEITTDGGDVIILGGFGLNVNTTGAAGGGIRTADNIISEAQGIQSLGTNAGLVFADRTSAQAWQWYGSSAIAILSNGSANKFEVTDAGQVIIIYADAITNTAPRALVIDHQLSSGTAAANFGVSISLQSEASAGTIREQALIQALWTDATDTTRNSDLRFFASDGNGSTNNLREGFRIGSTSANVAGIGFFGAGSTAKQTVTGVRTGTLAQLQTVVANLLTALSNYGLITDSTT